MDIYAPLATASNCVLGMHHRMDSKVFLLSQELVQPKVAAHQTRITRRILRHRNGQWQQVETLFSNSLYPREEGKQNKK